MSEVTSNNQSKKKFSFDKNGKKSKKKFIVIGILALIVIGSIFAFLNRNKGPEGEIVQTAAVSKGSIEQKIGISGVVSGTDSAEISSSLPYEIIQINFKEGDIVKKGDVLAVLDDRVLRNEVKMATNDLELSQMQMNEQSKTKVDTSTSAAEIQVRLATADKEEANRQLEIKKSLFDSGAIPKEEYLQAEIAAKKASAALDSANETLRKTREEINKALENAKVKGSQVKSLEIKREMIKQKQSDLEKVNIKSPIDGTITRVNAKLGRLATASDSTSIQSRALFIVENLSNLKMKVNVSEYDIGKVALGQKVWITSDVLGGDRIEASVARIAPTGELKEGSGTKEMVIPVTVEIKGNDPRLIAGISAQATIELNKKENILKVPVDAVYQIDKVNYVALDNNGSVRILQVNLGLESATEVEIISNDIKEGDKVILNPRKDYKDGDKINAGSQNDKAKAKDGEKKDGN